MSDYSPNKRERELADAAIANMDADDPDYNAVTAIAHLLFAYRKELQKAEHAYILAGESVEARDVPFRDSAFRPRG